MYLKIGKKIPVKRAN